ncbi:unnamed protein product [Schistosoma turkestanicum]|nr:unnamed protein product [Schistosoma turkestanicum]
MYWPGDAIINTQMTETAVYSCQRNEVTTPSSTSYRLSNLLRLVPTCLNQIISNLTKPVNNSDVVDLH